MKTLIMSLVVSLFSFGAIADEITCMLKSGKQKTAVTMDLDTEYEEGIYSEYIYDLNFYMEVFCKNTNCEVVLTVNSGMAEDEVGQTGFQFRRDNGKKGLFREPLTNTPDGRKYTLSCRRN